MEIIGTLLFDILLLSFYIISSLIIAFLIQGVVYWLTGFSIYNYLNKKLFIEVEKNRKNKK
jgi:hypothetical protein